MDEEHRLSAARVEIVDASATHLDKSLFVSRLRGLLLHGKKSFLASLPIRSLQPGPSTDLLTADAHALKALAIDASVKYWM
jgi:hypothetical protein